MPTPEQQFLLDNHLPDKCVGTLVVGKNGGVIVDGPLVYVSDLMRRWTEIKEEKILQQTTSQGQNAQSSASAIG